MSNSEPKGMLLSDEENSGLCAGLYSDLTCYSCCSGISKAQHLKTVKAVLEAIEEEFQETDDGWFIEFKDYEALKKQFGLDSGFRPTLKEAFEALKKQLEGK